MTKKGFLADDSLTEAWMAICYVFVQSEPDDTSTVVDRAMDFMTYIKVAPRKPPTWHHYCAGTTGEYQFLLQFEYASLSDVAGAVLRNRRRFEGTISRTMTILQYPNLDDHHEANARQARKKMRRQAPGKDEVASKDFHVRNLFAPATSKGIMLVQDVLAGPGGFGDRTHVLSRLNGFEGLTCIDIFGPYDYLIEFPARNARDFKRKVSCIRVKLGDDITRAVELFCEPISPWNRVEPAGMASTLGRPPKRLFRLGSFELWRNGWRRHGSR